MANSTTDSVPFLERSAGTDTTRADLEALAVPTFVPSPAAPATAGAFYPGPEIMS